MDEKEKVIKKFMKLIQAGVSPSDVLTNEEHAILEETYNELAVKHANLKSIHEWVNLTNLLPNGILSAEEKIEMIRLVLSRVPRDLK